MKRFVSILFCIVLIFALAVPSFASAEPFAGDHNNTLDALNNIDYYIYWIFQDFTDFFETANGWLSDIWQRLAGDISFELSFIRASLKNNDTNILDQVINIVSNSSNALAQLLDINDFTRANYDELDSFNTNFFGDVVHLTPFASSLTTLLEDISDTVVDESTETRTLIEDSVMPQLLAQFSRLYLGITNFRTDFKNEFDHTQVDSSGYALYMLQHVLADEEDLQFKEDNEEQKGNILNLAVNGFDGVGFGFFDIFSVFSHSFDSFGNYLFDADVQRTQVIGEIFDNQDIWAWFSSRNDVAINGVQTFARNSNEPEIVTDFYNQNKSELFELLGVDSK